MCKRIKMEITEEIDDDLKKVKFKFKNNIGLAVVYILLLIAFIGAIIWFFSLGGDIDIVQILKELNNKQELQVILFIITLIVMSIIFGPVYNLLKRIPDISDILVKKYGFIKKDNEGKCLYRDEISGEKTLFNYYVGDTFDFEKKFTFRLSNRYINTEFKYYLNKKSDRKMTDINIDILEFVNRYNSKYIPQYLRIEKCTYDANKNFLMITIKNNCLLYTLYNNFIIAKLLLLSYKESEKIVNEIIRNCIDIEKN